MIKKKNYGFRTKAEYEIILRGSLNEKIIKKISEIKEEPSWMLDIRLKAYKHFISRALPSWGPNLKKLNLKDIIWFAKIKAKKSDSWKNVPKNIRKVFDKLGIPEAERKFLGGVGAQFESEVVYHRLKKFLERQGVVFMDTDSALKEYPEIFRKYFGKVVPYSDNKFAALNTAVWSGGSFVYVPKNVKVEIPLQAYFRINAEGIGQFERTLIVVEPNAKVHYIEGCTAPIYSKASLHAAVVEIIAKENSNVRYTTIQNWSKNVYNLVTKRAHAYKNAIVEWVDGNLGSGITMKYPSVYLMGKGAKANIISVAFATQNQIIDSGAKVFHLAPETSSTIISKSICGKGGVANYRGLVYIEKNAKNSSSNVRCDALLLDSISETNTYPYNDIREDDVFFSHEASIGKVSEDQINYLMSRGFSEEEAINLIINGFIEIFSKELPLEYAIELNRLIALEIEGGVG